MVDSQTLWDQSDALARLLLAGARRPCTGAAGASRSGADETRWPLLGSPGQTKWHLWALSPAERRRLPRSGGPGAEAAATLQDSGGRPDDGRLAVYEAPPRGPRGGSRGALLGHVRRKFLECVGPPRPKRLWRSLPGCTRVEREYQDGPPDVWSACMALRQQKSRAVVAPAPWALEQRALPESALGQALKYLSNLWTGLTRFLNDTRVPLDNRATERALRGPALGRKNHYGSRSRRGTEVAALFYSLLESAKLCGVEPKPYLREAALAALRGEAIPCPTSSRSPRRADAPRHSFPPVLS